MLTLFPQEKKPGFLSDEFSSAFLMSSKTTSILSKVSTRSAYTQSKQSEGFILRSLNLTLADNYFIKCGKWKGYGDNISFYA